MTVVTRGGSCWLVTGSSRVGEVTAEKPIHPVGIKVYPSRVEVVMTPFATAGTRHYLPVPPSA
jgi:hypothetical protein